MIFSMFFYNQFYSFKRQSVKNLLQNYFSIFWTAQSNRSNRPNRLNFRTVLFCFLGGEGANIINWSPVYYIFAPNIISRRPVYDVFLPQIDFPAVKLNWSIGHQQLMSKTMITNMPLLIIKTCIRNLELKQFLICI